MEHIVQFAIGIDDETIKKNISEHAEKTITEQLLNDVERIVFDTDSWGRTVNKSRASSFTERQFEKFLEDNRESILEIAGKYLADKLARSKRGKEILENVADSEQIEG